MQDLNRKGGTEANKMKFPRAIATLSGRDHNGTTQSESYIQHYNYRE
jgi:hypothetical protein